MMWSDWGAMGLFGWTMMVVFWGALIFLIVWAVRSWGSSREVQPDAMEVLRQRYARGEIDREEYKERRGTLEDTNNRTGEA
jgi:putative membrane protein